MPRRIIALDFDGVLNSDAWFAKMQSDGISRYPIYNMIDPACVQRINRLVERSGADVVISSAWRIVHSLGEITSALRTRGFIGNVLGRTPSLGGERGAEIQWWLTAQGHSAEHLVILDDSSDMVHLMPCLVRTSPSVGLTDADVDRALVMFGIPTAPVDVEVLTMEDVG